MKKIAMILLIYFISFGIYAQNNADDYFSLGVDAYEDEEYMEAMKNFNKVVELDSLNEKAVIYKGLIKYQLADFRGALLDFNKSEDLGTLNDTLFLIRGITKIYLKDLDSGCLDLSKAGERGIEEAYEIIQEYCN